MFVLWGLEDLGKVIAFLLVGPKHIEESLKEALKTIGHPGNAIYKKLKPITGLGR